VIRVLASTLLIPIPHTLSANRSTCPFLVLSPLLHGLRFSPLPRYHLLVRNLPQSRTVRRFFFVAFSLRGSCSYFPVAAVSVFKAALFTITVRVVVLSSSSPFLVLTFRLFLPIPALALFRCDIWFPTTPTSVCLFCVPLLAPFFFFFVRAGARAQLLLPW